MPKVMVDSNRLAAMLASELAMARSGDDATNTGWHRKGTRQHAVRSIVLSTADLIVQEYHNDPNHLTNAKFSRSKFYVLAGLTPDGDLIP